MVGGLLLACCGTSACADSVFCRRADSVIDAQDWNDGDFLIVIGLWLTFRAPLEAVLRAKRAGVTTIVITGSRGSPLASAADHSIVVSTEGVSLHSRSLDRRPSSRRWSRTLQRSGAISSLTSRRRCCAAMSRVVFSRRHQLQQMLQNM